MGFINQFITRGAHIEETFGAKECRSFLMFFGWFMDGFLDAFGWVFGWFWRVSMVWDASLNILK